MVQQPDQATPEVLVWGGGSGGVAAALQAARSGARTLLLSPGPWLGGMVSAAGVCAPDGNELTPWQSGLWGALLRALAAAEPSGLDQNWVSCFGYRPASAEAILRRWVAAEARLQWWPLCRLVAVERQGDRIAAVRVERSGVAWRLQPQLVIDGSDRGELFPLAEAPFDLGWEASDTTGEPSAPSAQRLAGEPFFRRQPVQSPTWVVMGQLAEDTPAGAEPPTTELPAPFNGATDRFGLSRTLTYGRLPGGLVMLNWPLQGNDWHGGLERAFQADPVAQAALAAEMREHSRSFARVLEQASGGRLQPAAAFPGAEAAAAGDLEGPEALALMPYWREGRRLVGLERVLEQQLLPCGAGERIAPLPLTPDGRTSAIAVGNYANDHHYPGGDWPLAPKSCRWGGRWSGTPFAIPYGALVSATVVNLLAADKNLSVSHMANGATRLQPLVLNLGQAAGLAAALCVRQGLLPAELPVRQLQDALIDDPLAPASPVPLWDTPWHHPERAARQRAVLADPGALGPDGRLAGAAPGDPSQAPPEPQERCWRGELRPDGQGGFRLGGVPGPDGEPWPLITLEPALHDWLAAQERPRPVSLMGCANPWGPWLRVSRLIG
ncbi:MAG: FAD-dependent oxidoreductase [Cyanobacteriota bacterium]|nr:FAD-dependent oxidoreductase [Cyanobacteriota bacterium]